MATLLHAVLAMNVDQGLLSVSRIFLLALAAVFALNARAGQEPQPPPSPAAENAPPLKPQPIPFSHKVHAKFVTDCSYCHEMSASGWDMNYPSEAQCMVCHENIKTDSPAIKKLAEYASEKKPVPWVRVYQVQPFVFFSHRVHIKKGKLACEACHGPVAERDVLTREKLTTMAACMDCHKEKGAPVNCHTCHER